MKLKQREKSEKRERKRVRHRPHTKAKPSAGKHTSSMWQRTALPSSGTEFDPLDREVWIKNLEFWSEYFDQSEKWKKWKFDLNPKCTLRMFRCGVRTLPIAKFIWSNSSNLNGSKNIYLIQTLDQKKGTFSGVSEIENLIRSLDQNSQHPCSDPVFHPFDFPERCSEFISFKFSPKFSNECSL